MVARKKSEEVPNYQKRFLTLQAVEQNNRNETESIESGNFKKKLQIFHKVQEKLCQKVRKQEGQKQKFQHSSLLMLAGMNEEPQAQEPLKFTETKKAQKQYEKLSDDLKLNNPQL